MKPFELFMAEYEKQLHTAVINFPGEYGFDATAIPVVAARMRSAFQKGSYNKDGRAIKATCKALSIPYTYKGINEFIGEGN